MTHHHCTHPQPIRLPGPAQAILNVTINDKTLPPTEYQLENNLLYRIGKPWPHQNLNQPLGQPNTWSITYQQGNPPPPGTATLVAILAKEFLNATNGDNSKCRLPRNVRTVNRQGITYDIYDPQKMFANGKTGLPEIDLWLTAVNPNHLQEAPSVL